MTLDSPCTKIQSVINHDIDLKSHQTLTQGCAPFHRVALLMRSPGQFEWQAVIHFEDLEPAD